MDSDLRKGARKRSDLVILLLVVVVIEIFSNIGNSENDVVTRVVRTYRNAITNSRRNVLMAREEEVQMRVET